MRFFAITLMLAAVASVRINGVPELNMNKTAADDEYLRKVFDKYGEEDFISAHAAMFVARKVVGDWRGISGAELDDYVDANFAKTWHYYDTENKETIPIENAYFWVRQLADVPEHMNP